MPHALARRMKKPYLWSWVSFMVALSLFVAAALLSPETPASRAAHRRAAEAWQQRQVEKGAPKPPVQARPEWEATPPARALRDWDHRTFYRINHGWDNRFFDHAMPVLTAFGDGKTQTVLLLALLAWAVRARRRDWRVTALLGMVGVVLGLAAPLLKMVLPRYRPPSLYPFTDVILVHPLYGGSFPSGHTLTAFTIATVLARRHPWTAPWAFGLATLVGISRISVGVHWPTDVIGGAILGLLTGWITTYLWARREERRTRKEVART